MPWKPLQRNENAVALAVALLAGLTVVGAAGFFVLGQGERSVFDSFWMTMQILTRRNGTHG